MGDTGTESLIEVFQLNLDLDDRFYNWMRDCARRGMDEDEAIDSLMDRLQEYVSGEFDKAWDALISAGLVNATRLFLNDGDIDYYEAVVEIMNGRYEDVIDEVQSGSESVRSVMSSAYNRGRTAVSKASVKAKSKTPAKKAPSKKTASKSCESKASASKNSKRARR